METKGMECCKYLHFIVNFLLFIAGAIILGLGIWVKTSSDAFKTLEANQGSMETVIVMIVVGATLTLCGFFGCLGAVLENKCLLGFFFTFVLLVFLAEVTVIILILVNMPKLGAINSSTSANAAEMRRWNVLQTTVQCCGVKGPQDWGLNIPASCCKNSNPCTSLSSDLNKGGCQANHNQMFWIIVGFAIGSLFFEIAAMVSACCLCKNVGGYNPEVTAINRT